MTRPAVVIDIVVDIWTRPAVVETKVLTGGEDQDNGEQLYGDTKSS